MMVTGVVGQAVSGVCFAILVGKPELCERKILGKSGIDVNEQNAKPAEI